jgi:hypothetical protein
MNSRTIISVALIVASFHASAATLTGKVVKVADGEAASNCDSTGSKSISDLVRRLT